jgi:pyruvate,water dikinase
MFVRGLKDLSMGDISAAGGKGASLGELTKIGMRVPSGFVVLTNAFELYLERSGLKEKLAEASKEIRHSGRAKTERVLAVIRAGAMNAEIPSEVIREIKDASGQLEGKRVAVRSSATIEDSKKEAWAGEFESCLNVTTNQIIRSVRICWASFFTSDVVFLTLRGGERRPKPSMAVVIQKMVQSKVSGVCFTVHPISRDNNQLIIEAAFGLGDSVVEGKVVPDRYVISKKQLSIAECFISEQAIATVKGARGNIRRTLPRALGQKQKLTSRQILKLAKICIDIERHYSSPQDIEWALERDKICILQARPITTL